MSALRFAKRAVMQVLDSAELNSRIINSTWRQRRLLIICWHGVSNDDEHAWNPRLFMPPDAFRMRLEMIRDMKCSVLPLREGLARVRTASLPPRAVCLTVDDGDSSFRLKAWPMLREFGFPATLYWTTYYSVRPYAVFDPMLSYLLWKGRDRSLALRDPPLHCGLRSAEERVRAFTTLYELTKSARWSAEQKELLLAEVASQLRIDYAQLKAKRILHLITPAEARLMASEGLDLQLHTHRHRVPPQPEEFGAELSENRRIIQESGATAPAHFCYPSGSFLPEYAAWLRNIGIESATTCESGLVERHTDPYFLPRLIDHPALTAAEFKGWLSGIAASLLARHRMDQHGFR